MNKKLILTLFAAVSLFSTATLQQNRAFATCSFELTDQEDINHAIKNHINEYLKNLKIIFNSLKRMCTFLNTATEIYTQYYDEDFKKTIEAPLITTKKLEELEKDYNTFKYDINHVKDIAAFTKTLVSNEKFKIFEDSENLQEYFEDIKKDMIDLNIMFNKLDDNYISYIKPGIKPDTALRRFENYYISADKFKKREQEARNKNHILCDKDSSLSTKNFDTIKNEIMNTKFNPFKSGTCHDKHNNFDEDTRGQLEKQEQEAYDDQLEKQKQEAYNQLKKQIYKAQHKKNHMPHKDRIYKHKDHILYNKDSSLSTEENFDQIKNEVMNTKYDPLKSGTYHDKRNDFDEDKRDQLEKQEQEAQDKNHILCDKDSSLSTEENLDQIKNEIMNTKYNRFRPSTCHDKHDNFDEYKLDQFAKQILDNHVIDCSKITELLDVTMKDIERKHNTPSTQIKKSLAGKIYFVGDKVCFTKEEV